MTEETLIKSAHQLINGRNDGAEAGIARLLEDEIERRGLQKQYLDELADIVDSTEFDRTDYPWLLVHATPEQRARAFLEVIQ